MTRQPTEPMSEPVQIYAENNLFGLAKKTFGLDDPTWRYTETWPQIQAPPPRPQDSAQVKWLRKAGNSAAPTWLQRQDAPLPRLQDSAQALADLIADVQRKQKSGLQPNEGTNPLHCHLRSLVNDGNAAIQCFLGSTRVEWVLWDRDMIGRRAPSSRILSPIQFLREIISKVDEPDTYYRGDSAQPVSMLQSLPLLANGIEKWVSENAATLSDADKTAFADALTKFRAASQEVTEFYDYARGYLAHLERQEAAAQERPKGKKVVTPRGETAASAVAAERAVLTKRKPGRE